jgi:hypothetical protein
MATSEAALALGVPDWIPVLRLDRGLCTYFSETFILGSGGLLFRGTLSCRHMDGCSHASLPTWPYMRDSCLQPTTACCADLIEPLWAMSTTSYTVAA